MLVRVSFLWRMDNLWHMMPRSDEQKKLHHLQKPLRPPTSGYAPQQKPRKQTSKRSWWEWGTPDLLKKWQTFWKFGCRFFLAEKRFAQGYLGLQIQLAKSVTSVGYAMLWIKATKALNPVGFCVLILRFQPPKERSFWMIKWLLSCLGCTIRMVNQPFSIGDLEPWKKLPGIIFHWRIAT